MRGKKEKRRRSRIRAPSRNFFSPPLLLFCGDFLSPIHVNDPRDSGEATLFPGQCLTEYLLLCTREVGMAKTMQALDCRGPLLRLCGSCVYVCPSWKSPLSAHKPSPKKASSSSFFIRPSSFCDGTLARYEGRERCRWEDGGRGDREEEEGLGLPPRSSYPRGGFWLEGKKEVERGLIGPPFHWKKHNAADMKCAHTSKKRPSFQPQKSITFSLFILF